MIEVTLALSAHMLLMGNIAASEENALNMLNELLESGAAFDKFCHMVESQHGDVSLLHEPDRYPRSKFRQDILASRDGIIADINALTIGLSVVDLGGGRQVMEDQIDFKAGVLLHHKVGDFIHKGEPLATIYSDREKAIERISHSISEAFVFANKPVVKPDLIIDVVKP